MVPPVPPVGGHLIPELAGMVIVIAAIPLLFGVLLAWGGSKAKAKPAQMVGWLLILAAGLGLVWYFGMSIFDRARVNGVLWIWFVDLKMGGRYFNFGQLQLPADFAGLLSFWPLIGIAMTVILLVGFARWVLNATRAPAARKSEDGEGAGGFLGGLDIVRLAEGLLATAVIVVVTVSLARYFGIGVPIAGPSPLIQAFTFFADAIRKNPTRVVATAEFLKRPELELGPITRTLTIEQAELKVAMVNEEIAPWGRRDQRGLVEVSQDAREEVANWVDGLARRLARNGLNPFMQVPGFTQLALRVSELEMHGSTLEPLKVWAYPPDEGGEVRFVIQLIPLEAIVRSKAESIAQRALTRSSPPVTEKEVSEAQALALNLKVTCVANWGQLQAGQRLLIPKRYEAMFLDMIYSPPGVPMTGLCDWVEHWADRLQQVVVR